MAGIGCWQSLPTSRHRSSRSRTKEEASIQNDTQLRRGCHTMRDVTDCPRCGVELSDRATTCPQCGHSLMVVCSDCGTSRHFSLAVCLACGSRDVTPERDVVRSRQTSKPEAVPSPYQELARDPEPAKDEPIWAADEQAARQWGNAIELSVAAVVGVLAIWGIFNVFDRDRAPELEVLSSTVVSATTPTTQPPTTTAPPTTLPPSTVPAIAPVGNPIPEQGFLMSAGGLEPFEFGTDFMTLLGRLVATFGQPDEVLGPIASTGEFGTCPGELVTAARFSRLVVIATGDEGSSELVAFRLDARFDPRPRPSLKTLSHLGLLDSVKLLRDTYETSLEVRFVEDPVEGLVFQLWREDGRMLLWGPVSSQDDDGTVLGIYSAPPCSSGG